MEVVEQLVRGVQQSFVDVEGGMVVLREEVEMIV